MQSREDTGWEEGINLPPVYPGAIGDGETGEQGAAFHYSDVIMSAMASQITSLGIVYSTVCSGADHWPMTVRGIPRWPVNSPHKGPVKRKMFPFVDVVMVWICSFVVRSLHSRSDSFTTSRGPFSWWRHQMETFSALLAICTGNSPVNSLHKGQWRGAVMFSLICARINGRVNNREAGDLRRHGTHYDVIVMYWYGSTLIPSWLTIHMHSKMWDKITYPFQNFNGCIAEVWINHPALY